MNLEGFKHGLQEAVSSLDIKAAANILSALAAWVALFLSFSNARAAKSALALAREQDRRRQPKVIPYLADSYFLRTTNSRIFACSISITNPTDIDNSLVRTELEVSYDTPGGLEATVRIPAAPALVSQLGGYCGNVIAVPQPVEAHKAVAGWLLFELKHSLLSGGRPDAFSVVLEDSHGLETRLDPGLSRQLHDENTTWDNSDIAT